MTHFVLVPGAWLGAWAWEQVADGLRRGGVDVTAMTLSGVSDRSDVPHDEVRQSTHVADIVTLIEGQDLRDVVLVGHSYSGIPVGQAAMRIGDRLRRVVYTDALIAHDGQTFMDRLSPEDRDALESEIVDNDGYWQPITADDLAGQDLSDESIAEMGKRQTPHPGACLTDLASLTGPLTDLPSTYIKCLMNGDEPTDDIKEALTSPSWRLVEMNTGHWPMFSQPDQLIKVLLEQR